MFRSVLVSALIFALFLVLHMKNVALTAEPNTAPLQEIPAAAFDTAYRHAIDQCDKQAYCVQVVRRARYEHVRHAKMCSKLQMRVAIHDLYVSIKKVREEDITEATFEAKAYFERSYTECVHNLERYASDYIFQFKRM